MTLYIRFWSSSAISRANRIGHSEKESLLGVVASQNCICIFGASECETGFSAPPSTEQRHLSRTREASSMQRRYSRRYTSTRRRPQDYCLRGRRTAPFIDRRLRRRFLFRDVDMLQYVLQCRVIQGGWIGELVFCQNESFSDSRAKFQTQEEENR